MAYNYKINTDSCEIHLAANQTLGLPSGANPRLPESPSTRKGEGGTIKKLDTGRQACSSAESPGLGSFPCPDPRGSRREPQRQRPPRTCATTQPPGRREGGRARQERQNPAFDQPPSTTHYASKRKDQGPPRAAALPPPSPPGGPGEARGPPAPLPGVGGRGISLQRAQGLPGHFVSSVSTPSLHGEGPIPPLRAAPYTHQHGAASFPAPIRPPTPIRNNAPGWRRSPPPAPGRQEGQLG
ncbi:basic salivary proline-rich protein 4-like [Melospiza georgiana]|uniref:basic salivary proline-rich protein 4-like n=1 Tax=Melospiza georgiana TaxID=44398 RepID=UPI0025AD4411|nr:basic salivary proline-rich protein 4-like [Melospiza georgiana]